MDASTGRSSLAGRAAAAVALMIGFYVLALAVIGALLYIPYAEYVYAHRISPRLAIACVIGALAVLAAILPRRDKFEAPGPLLLPQDQRELFGVIEGVARDTGQAMPKEVYLVPDVNAFVTERGGVMGVGSRRVMGIGLPLVQTLTVSEMRAVLAHEFGHFHHGDTALGPWIYVTRAAMVRTLVSLERSALQLVFLWYWKAFLRITHAISRAQEFSADALAARVAGPGALASGLRKVAGAAAAHTAFLQEEVTPVIDAGLRPALVPGFPQYLQSRRVQGLVHVFVAVTVEKPVEDPYDTHPPLPRRLEALARAASAAGATDDRPAVALLRSVERYEVPLLNALAGSRRFSGRALVAWSDVGQLVHLPAWRRVAARYAAALRGVTPGSLPIPRERLVQMASRIATDKRDAGELAARGAGAIAAAIAVHLDRCGWTLSCELGEPVIFRRGADEIRPFELPQQLVEGPFDAAAWQVLCARTEIGGADLGAVVV